MNRENLITLQLAFSDTHNTYSEIREENSGQRTQIARSEADRIYAAAMSGIQPHGSHLVPYSYSEWNAPRPQSHGWPRAQQPAYYPAAHAVPYYNQHAGYQTARRPRMIVPPPPPASPRPPPEPMEAVVPVEPPPVATTNLNLEELSALIAKVLKKLLPPRQNPNEALLLQEAPPRPQSSWEFGQ